MFEQEVELMAWSRAPSELGLHRSLTISSHHEKWRGGGAGMLQLHVPFKRSRLVCIYL